jgi:hypothetical protein
MGARLAEDTGGSGEEIAAPGTGRAVTSVREDDPARSPPLPPCFLPLLGVNADLLEQCHGVEVVAACLDLVALEDVEDGGGCLLPLA